MKLLDAAPPRRTPTRAFQPAEPMVLAAAASGFEAFIERLGGDPLEILQKTRLQPGAHLRPTKRISLRSYLAAMDEAAHRTGSSDFGLRFGTQFAPESLGPWGYVALASETLGQAMRNMCHHFAAFQQGGSLCLQLDRGSVRIEYQISDGSILSRRHDAELTLCILRNVVERALGPSWHPQEVSFSHPAPARTTEHDRVFGCKVRFGQKVNALVLSESELWQRMPQADARLLHTMEDLMGLLLGQSQLEPSSASSQVRNGIVEALPQGQPKLTSIAEKLRLPAWTLQRHLKEEGETFASLLDAVRQELAASYLREADLSISDITMLLGYTEVSSFTHAFGRWHGMSPSTWRVAKGRPTQH